MYTLHKPVIRRFKRRATITSGVGEQLQLDLADVSAVKDENNGFKWLLFCIDIFSKKAWVVPLKTKSSKAVLDGFKSILEESGLKPKYVQSDKGTEFTNRLFQAFLKREKIIFFTTENVETKASIVERLQRTIKSYLWRAFTRRGDFKYIDILPGIVKAYNNTPHTSHGYKPVEVNRRNQETVWNALYADTKPPPSSAKPKLEVGDKVRVTVARSRFKKGYKLGAWTEEVFTVTTVTPGNPHVYKIADDSGEELKGTFYERELQKIDKKDDVYRVERVIKTKKVRGRKQYLVKWRGYGEKFNSWITDADWRKYS